MNRAEQLSNFLLRATSDSTLSAIHISLCAALCSSWIASGFNNPFDISRKRLMNAARIKSKSTYHKIIKDLVDLKYLDYRPSFHPMRGSEVSLIISQ